VVGLVATGYLVLRKDGIVYGSVRHFRIDESGSP
jgi:hypothetical protein